MSILVVGGTGFIGRRLVRSLLRAGHRVVSAARTAPSASVTNLLTPVQLDVTRLEDILAVIREHDVDRVVSLAYIMGPPADQDPYRSLVVNVMGAANTFEAARLGNVRRIVYASSVAYYGFQQSYGEHPINEDELHGHAASLYGGAKRLNETLARKYSDNYGIETVCLRIPVVYGHGRRGRVWSSDFASLPATGQRVTINYSKESTVCFSYVDDVADTLAMLCVVEYCGAREYNAEGHTVTLDLACEVVRNAIKDADITFSGQMAVPFPYLIDSGRLTREFGSSIRTLEEGIQDHIRVARNDTS